MNRAGAVVVGAGAMGSAAAWRLAQRGLDVVVLEQFEAGHARGSSHGSARIFRLAYDVQDYVVLARRALTAWRDVEAAAGVPLLELTGGVDHGDPVVLDTIAAALSAEDVHYKWLAPDEAARRWPMLRFDRAVLYQADAGRLHASRAVSAFQDLARAAGAVFRFGTPVHALTPVDDSVLVVTPDGDYVAGVVVVTAGAWAGPLLAGLVDLPPLTVTREQPAYFRALDPAGGWPSFIHHGLPQGAHFGLGTPDRGVKIGVHRSGPVADPDQPGEPDPARVRELCSYLREWVPGVDPEPAAVETCLYTLTPDEDFVIDRRGPVVVGSPCSGHGFKFTPVIGELIADVATGAGSIPRRFALR